MRTQQVTNGGIVGANANETTLGTKWNGTRSTKYAKSKYRIVKGCVWSFRVALVKKYKRNRIAQSATRSVTSLN